MTEAETTKIVYVMLATYGQGQKHDAKTAENMITGYHAVLGDLSYERCNAAVRVLMGSLSFIPKPNEIRAAVMEIEHGPVLAGGDAWGEVESAFGRYGAYRTPGADFRWSDPVTARCVEALGWKNLCSAEGSAAQRADRARFIELYDTLAKQERLEQQVPLLAQARELRERGELASAGDLVAGLLSQVKEAESKEK